MGGIIAQDIPSEALPQEGNPNPGPAEIHHRESRKDLGQKLQQQIFKNGDQIADNHKQPALPDPSGGLRMTGGKLG